MTQRTISGKKTALAGSWPAALQGMGDQDLL